MPFIQTIEYSDYEALRKLSELAELDPSYLAEVLADPALNEDKVENVGLTISLLHLKFVSPEAWNAIQALPWIQDGISKPPNEGQPDQESTTAYEHITVSSLLEMARRSPELLVGLTAKPWMHELTNYLKWRMTSELAELASRDVESALQVVGMAFLEDLQKDDEAALQMMNILGRSGLGRTGYSGPESLQKMLINPDFIKLAASENTGEISGIVAKIIIEVEFPEESEVLNSYPWVQDGIDVSEYPAMHDLAEFLFGYTSGRYSIEVIRDLLARTWMLDGLTEEERRAVNSLRLLAQHEESNAISLLAMPFLESVDATDASALSTFSVLSSQRSPGYVKQVLSHPAFESGITDTQAAIIADSYWQIRDSLEVLDQLFNPQNS